MKSNNENSEIQNEIIPFNRRDFIRSTAVLGAAMCVPSILMSNSEEKNLSSQMNSTPIINGQRTLGSGKYSMQVSEIGFGIMGMNYHRGIHPDKKAMIKLGHQAVDKGITLFDTAETYGPFSNEELAGEIFSSFKNKIAVTTKFGFNYDGNKVIGVNSRPERIREMVENSLRRLKIDVIELLYQHRFDPNVPIEDVAGTVKDLIIEGKVKRFGLCEVGGTTIRKAHAEQPVTAIQSEYHLMWREPEKEIFQVCKELGIGFVPYSPLNRGFLTGSINEYTSFDSGNDNRNILPRFTPEAVRANLRIVEELNKFGRTRGITAAQTALGWMMQKESWIVPIPGTTKLSHLEENLRTTNFSFTQKEWNELETNISNIRIMGDRYPASEQNQIGK
nr:aldo/keto reductase [uncultured Chryseobacterium sp.]